MRSHPTHDAPAIRGPRHAISVNSVSLIVTSPPVVVSSRGRLVAKVIAPTAISCAVLRFLVSSPVTLYIHHKNTHGQVGAERIPAQIFVDHLEKLSRADFITIPLSGWISGVLGI